MIIEVIDHDLKMPYVADDLIARKCHKLERMLNKFYPETISLKCDLSLTPGKKAYRLKLTLQIPNAALHTTSVSNSIVTVFGAAFKNLFQSVSKLKTTLRADHETEQKRKNAEQAIADFSIPQSARKIFATFYSKNFGRFYNYALREIRFRSYQGYTKPGIIDVNDVLNEAFLSVAEKLDLNFTEEEITRSYFEEIRKVIDQHLNPGGTALVPIEEPIEPEDIDSMYQEYYQPDEIIKVEDILIDADSIPPEGQVEYKEIETLIDKLLAQLPADWRDAFILSVREGLSISDIAGNKGKGVDEIRNDIECAKTFIHDKLSDSGFRWQEQSK